MSPKQPQSSIDSRLNLTEKSVFLPCIIMPSAVQRTCTHARTHTQKDQGLNLRKRKL
jgi:hypothetical protein